MHLIAETIRNNYKASGENERYVGLFNSYKELNGLFKNGELVKEKFEKQFSVNVEDLDFPVITIDSSGMNDGYLYDVKSSREEIMSRADKYFDESIHDKAWIFQDYVVFEDAQYEGESVLDALRFEKRVIEHEGTIFEGTKLPKGKYDMINAMYDGYYITESKGEVIGSISFENGVDLIHQSLNSGADPIAEGWFNNKEEIITLDGWGEFDQSKEKITTRKKDLEMDV